MDKTQRLNNIFGNGKLSSNLNYWEFEYQNEQFYILDYIFSNIVRNCDREAQMKQEILSSAKKFILTYDKLISLNPTVYCSMTNSLGQKIDLVEHPLQGDTSPIIAICRELKLVATTNFYETDDMLADHKEYEPLFINNLFQHGQ